MKIRKNNPLKHACLFLAALSLALVALCAQANTLWFDGGTTGIASPGDGASTATTGNWNTTATLTNWDVGAGLDHVAWNNTANGGDTAVFGGTAGPTVTVGTVSVGNLTLAQTTGRVTFSGGTITLGTVSSTATIDCSAMVSASTVGCNLASTALAGTISGGLTIIGNNANYATYYNVVAPTRANNPALNTSNSFVASITISNTVEAAAVSSSGTAPNTGRQTGFGPAGNNITLNNGTIFCYQGTAGYNVTNDHNINVIGTANALNDENQPDNYTFTGSLTTSGSSDALWSVAHSTSPGGKMIYSGDLSGFTGTFNVRGGTTATPGTTVIDCASTFGGTFYVDNGVLQIGNGDTKGTLGGNDIVNNGTISYNRTDSQAYAHNITGTGALKVNRGTFLLNGYVASSVATTVATNGTLAGSGTFAGPVTLQAGGTLAAGTASLGTLTINGNLTLNAGSTNLMRISKSGATLTCDQITGLPGLAYAGTLTVVATGDALGEGDTFTLFTLASGAYSGGFGVVNLPSLPSGKSWDLTQLLVSGSIRVAGGAAAPTFSPPAGSYSGAQSVTISSLSPGATIHYTTDGSMPTSGSPSGASPVTVVVPADATTTLKAYASAPGYSDSGVSSATYVTLSHPIWLNAAGGSWATAANWLSDVIATGVGVPADFSTLGLSGDATVTLDSAPTVGSLLFADTSSTANWILNSGTGGPLTLNAGANVPVIGVSNQTATIGAVLSGTNGLTKTGNGTLVLAAANLFTGNVTISNGLVRSTVGNLGSNTGLGVSNVVTVAAGTTLDIGGANGTGNQLGASEKNTLTVNGGTLNFSLTGSGYADGPYLGTLNLNGASVTSTNADGSPNGSGPRFGYSHGNGVINATGSASTWSAPMWLLYSASQSGKSMTINAAADLAISGVIWDYSGLGGLPVIKTGAGTLTLSAPNAYAGTTTVSNGTLVLESLGALGAGALTVQAGATLAGTGYINGPTTIQGGGTLTLGTANVDALKINSTLALAAGSTTYLKINKTGGSPSADSVQGLTSVTYGGTLVVTDITSDTTPLAAGDTFSLFSAGAYSGSFNSNSLPVLPAGLSWDITTLASGYIQVVNAVAPLVFNPPAGNYVGAQTVNISSLTPGATIYYTTDGTTPTTGSAHGTTPVTVIVPVNTNLTILAYATAAGYSDSLVASAPYATIVRPTWLNAGGGSWSGSYNWSNNIIANMIGAPADIATLTLTANTLITLDSAPTVGQLLFADTGNTYGWALDNGAGGPLTLDAGTNVPVISVSNQTTTISATLAGTSGLTKTGNGTLVLSSPANTYSGATTIGAGALTIDVAGRLGSGSYGGNITNDTVFVYNGTNAQTLSGAISGPGVLTNTGSLTLSGSSPNTYNGMTTVAGGSLTLNKTAGVDAIAGNIVLTGGLLSLNTSNQIADSASVAISGGAGGTGGIAGTWVETIASLTSVGNLSRVNFGSGSAVVITGNFSLTGNNGAANANAYSLAANSLSSMITVGSLFLDNAYYKIGQLVGGFASTLYLNGDLTGTNSSSVIVGGGTPLFVLNGPGTHNHNFNITGGTTAVSANIAEAASSTGSLTKLGTGVLTLSGTNTYSGITMVSNGTLLVNGSLVTSPVTAKAGTTLGGTGIIGGAVNVAGTMAPGENGIGTLTIHNTLTLNGGSTTTLAINRAAGVNSYSRVAGLTSVTFGGTLTVTNPGGAFQAGDSFQLFNVGSGSNFTATNLPSAGAGLSWNWNPTTGVLSVVSTGPSGPGSITNSVSGSTLTLTWPAGQGWRLVSQTNSAGLDTNRAAWGTVPGISDGSATITIDQTKPSVFYRLVYP
jgi:fibronectin-binding autotransporter adhesin